MIHVESEPGKGTALHDSPASYCDAEKKWEGPEMALIPEGTGHILYVDDEEPIASLGWEMLTSLGYDVAVRLSSPRRPGGVPGKPAGLRPGDHGHDDAQLTGARLAGEMLKIRPDLPVILTTGFSERMDRGGAEARLPGFPDEARLPRRPRPGREESPRKGSNRRNGDLRRKTISNGNTWFIARSTMGKTIAGFTLRLQPGSTRVHIATSQPQSLYTTLLPPKLRQAPGMKQVSP